LSTSLSGRAAIVTGASRGIGKGIAVALARAGASVLAVARDSQAVRRTAEELRSSGMTVEAEVGDVSDTEAVERIARTALERFGGIDVVCCNAGIFPQNNLDDLSVTELTDVLQTNLVGSMMTVKACLPALRASGQGRVILTSSITGPVTGMPGFTAYAASKAGQLGFMRAAAVELARDGITVNAILPGNIATEGLATLGDDYRRNMELTIPGGRLGTVDDIGHAAVYLASAEASFVTGQALIVDGGQVLPESLLNEADGAAAAASGR
jgi:3-oxoacyl-[acyl-carrier protein] reductase